MNYPSLGKVDNRSKRSGCGRSPEKIRKLIYIPSHAPLVSRATLSSSKPFMASTLQVKETASTLSHPHQIATLLQFPQPTRPKGLEPQLRNIALFSHLKDYSRRMKTSTNRIHHFDSSFQQPEIQCVPRNHSNLNDNTVT